jgi:hypothetical protein
MWWIILQLPKRIIKHFKLKKQKRRVVEFGLAIELINRKFRKMGYPDWKIEQFWKKFTGSRNFREDFIEKMEL